MLAPSAPLLAECADYFIQAHYAYERIGGYNLSGIRTLAKGLLDAVKAFSTKNPRAKYAPILVQRFIPELG